jgi:signal peptidase I
MMKLLRSLIRMGESDVEPEADKAAAAMKSEGSWLWELIRTWGPAILAVIVIRTFIFEPFRIPSGSMVPTLLIGDHVVVTKFSYGIWLRTPNYIPLLDIPLDRFSWRKELIDLGDPERGDIIVFMYPMDETTNYIKRVVGIPGDHIHVEDNRIFLNGVEQPTVRHGEFTFIDDDCTGEPKKMYEEDLSGVKHPILTNTGLGGVLSNMDDEIVVPAGHVFVMGDNRDNSEDSRRWKFVRFDQIKGKAHRIWLSWDGCSGSIGRIRSERFLQSLYGPLPEPDAKVPGEP